MKIKKIKVAKYGIFLKSHYLKHLEKILFSSNGLCSQTQTFRKMSLKENKGENSFFSPMFYKLTFV
jgi:hypothetical protein